MKKRSRDYTAARNRLKDLLSAHKSYKGTHMDMTKKFMDMRNDFNLPSHHWRWMEGYFAARVDEWYRHDLAFGYIVDGVVYPQKWEKMPEEHRQLARENKLVSNHYWLETPFKLSNKHF